MRAAIRFLAIFGLMASAMRAFASEPPRAEEEAATPEAFAELMRMEVAWANPFKAIEKRNAEIADAKERERKAREEAEQRKREATLAFLEAEWIAGDPESFIRFQNETIKQLQAKLAAQNTQLAKIEKKEDEQTANDQKQYEALKKELDEIRKLIDEKQKAAEEREQALKKENEDLKERADSAARERKEIARSTQHVINVLRERVLRDFETQEFDGIEFVRIPAGSFTMGTTDAHMNDLRERGHWSELNEAETPARRVTITKPFFISKHEITQKHWKSVFERDPSAFEGDDLPAESMNYGRVQQFIEKLQEKSGGIYRLPTEAEWEYCARAGGEGLFGAGVGGETITFDNINDYAWTSMNAEEKTHPAGQKKPNAWGLHDMYGNVWEWCVDWYDPEFYASAPENDPRADKEGTERAFRGGAYGLEPQHARAAKRGGNLPSFRSPYVGFRLVREIKNP